MEKYKGYKIMEENENNEEKRWFVSEDTIANFIKNKTINIKPTNWIMTIYTLLFICALVITLGVGLAGIILLFIPLFILFAPIMWIENKVRERNKQKELNYEDFTERED